LPAFTSDARTGMGVWNETARVLERGSGEILRPSLSSLSGCHGQTDVCRGHADQALAADPDLIDGYVYLALTYSRMGRMRDAEATVARASSASPIAQRSSRSSSGTCASRSLPGAGEPLAPAAANANPHAGLDAPVDQGTEERGTACRDRRSRSFAQEHALARGDPLRVRARRAGATEGPPVAVKRLRATFSRASS